MFWKNCDQRDDDDDDDDDDGDDDDDLVHYENAPIQIY